MTVFSVAQQQQTWKNQDAFFLSVVLVLFNTHLLLDLFVKETEIQATKMESLVRPKEAGAGIKP